VSGCCLSGALREAASLVPRTGQAAAIPNIATVSSSGVGAQQISCDLTPAAIS
jgi:hypothetical protein